VSIGNNAVANRGVSDFEQTSAHVLDKGAEPRQPVRDVGGDIRTAIVADPFGNVTGLIHNPHFTMSE
jgi:hypothetical protein